jgi:hypothetical protein
MCGKSRKERAKPMVSTDSPGEIGKLYAEVGSRAYDTALKAGIDAGVKAAVDYLAEERKTQKRSRNDRRLRNTRLLLKNYRAFRKHSSGAVYSSNRVKENAIDILDSLDYESLDSNLYVESIKKSQQRTLIVVKHIDEMLEFYRISCEQSGKPEEVRRYQIIYLLYIDEENHTYQQVADLMHVDITTVYNDVKHAIKPLSALIFGIDSLRFE